MELATSASASVCSAYCHLSSTPPAANGVSHGTQTSQPSRRRRPVAGGGLRRRCYAVLKQQRTRLYILRRCISMLLCWHEQDLAD